MTEDELFAALRRDYPTAQIARVVVREQEVSVFTGRPGILIGKRGATIEKIKAWLDETLGPTRLAVHEIRRIELEPVLVADAVVMNLERGVALEPTLDRHAKLSVRAGARACRIAIYGALGEHERQAIAGEATAFDWTDGIVGHAAVDGATVRCEVWVALPAAARL